MVIIYMASDTFAFSILLTCCIRIISGTIRNDPSNSSFHISIQELLPSFPVL